MQVEDLQQIQRLLQERHSMRIRVGSGAVLTDGSLTISDVPTLVKMIKDSIEPVAHKAAREESSHKVNGLTVVEAFAAPLHDLMDESTVPTSNQH
jgi:hypothetical protein